jgi:hypothetical protein
MILLGIFWFVFWVDASWLGCAALTLSETMRAEYKAAVAAISERE